MCGDLDRDLGFCEDFRSEAGWEDCGDLDARPLSPVGLTNLLLLLELTALACAASPL